MNNTNQPPYERFPTLLNEFITLREIKESDLSLIREISYYDAIQAQTIEQAQEMQEKIMQDYSNGNSIHWGIIDNSKNIIVGTCGYYRGFKDMAGELGCVLLPASRGSGYMVSAMQLAIDFGLEQMKLKRIWAVTSPANEKAIKLLMRLNFKEIKKLSDDELQFELL